MGRLSRGLAGILFATLPFVSACESANNQPVPSASPKDQVKIENVRVSSNVDERGYRIDVEEWDEVINGVRNHHTDLINVQREDLTKSSCETSLVIPNTYGKLPHLNRADDGYNTLRHIKRALENVPDPMQKLVNDFGGTVRIVGDIGEVQRLYDGGRDKSLAGFYNTDTKIATSPIDETDVSSHYALHEYGHAVFDVFTWYSVIGFDSFENLDKKRSLLIPYIQYRQEALEWSNLYRRYSGSPNARMFLGSHATSNSNEFFAETFAMYYNDMVTRHELKDLFPEIYDFHQKMYDKMTVGCRTSTISPSASYTTSYGK